MEIHGQLTREKIQQNTIRTYHIGTKEQSTDLFTNGLSSKQNEYLIDKLGMVDICKHTSLWGSVKKLHQEDKCASFS